MSDALLNTSNQISQNAKEGKSIHIKPAASDYKSYNSFNFQKAESSGLSPSFIVDSLKKLDTDIQWGDLEGLSTDEQYNALKQTPFNINLNTPQSARERILSKEALKYNALKGLKEYEHTQSEKSFLDRGLDFVSESKASILGYEDERYRKNQESGKNVLNALVSAGVDSKELQDKGINAPSLSNTIYNEKGVLSTAKDIITGNNGAAEFLDNAIKAHNLFKTEKSTQELTKEDKEIIKDKLGFFSSIFKDDEERYTQFRNLVRAEELANSAIKSARMLENVLPSQQFLQELWSGESISEKQAQALKDYEVIAKEFGFEAIAYNQNGLYFIKSGKVFQVDENFNDMLLNVLKDNKGSIALGIAGAIKGSKKGFKSAVVGGAIGGFTGGAIDSLLTDLYFENKDFSIAQALLHGAQEGAFNVAGDLAFAGVGAVIKGVKNGTFFKISGSEDKKTLSGIFDKLSESLSGQNIGAIDRALNQQTKLTERKANTKAFLQSQSSTSIQEEFKNPTLIKNLFDKVKDYIPLNKIDKEAAKDAGVSYKRAELLANVLRNKDLADSLAGQLDDVEARILSQAMDKMAKDFKALSGDYEKLIAREVLKDEFNPSLPMVFQKAVEEAEQKVKNQYKEAIFALQDELKGEKLDLITPFKKMADYAIADYGINSDIAKTLINEVKNLEGREISIKEALEKRKDINQILRNYNDNPNSLKKFRINESMNELKAAIDNTLANAIEAKIARLRKGNTASKIEARDINKDLALSAKQKTINAVDNYAQSAEFKALSPEKQQAILSLKYIEPSPMPQGAVNENLQNLVKHFENKQDLEQRSFYINLLEDTKANADIVLETLGKNGEERKEYIKAYQHKPTHDLYYIAITQENDKINITGFPITRIKNVINQITKAKEVNSIGSSRIPSYTHLFDKISNHSLEVANTIIPQLDKENNLRKLLSDFNEANAAYADIKKRLNDKLTKAIFMDKPKKSTINSLRTTEEWKKAVLDKQWVDSIQGLENTIFAKFNPRMQEATQTIMIFRALERHIKEVEGASVINLNKALKDIESLEKLPLHPQAQNALNIFKELSKIYQFANKISGAKGFKSGAGNGALSTSLEGRAKVFLTNRLFKNLFFRVPYVGDKDAVLFHLKKAVRDLKYPRAITLDMLSNPHFTNPSPKSPLNPKGEPYISAKMTEEINAYAGDENVLKDEFRHKRGENTKDSLENALTPQAVIQKIENNSVLYTGVGDGSITRQELAEIKEILQKGHSLQEQSAQAFTYHTQATKGIASLRAELKVALTPYTNKEITNKETGLKGKISTSEINKISSQKAVDKSVANGFSRDEHFKVSENLKELFENAHLKETHTDYKERPNIVAVHRFNAPLNINDKEAVAKITLFEKKVGNNRIYTLELEELNKPDSLASASNSTESAVKAQSMGDIAHEAPTIAKTDNGIIPQSKASLENKVSLESKATFENILQEGNSLSLTLSNGKKILIQQDNLNNIYIQSNYTKPIRSYDEAQIEQSLQTLAQEELEQKFINTLYSKNPKRPPLVERTNAEQILSQELKKAREDEAYFMKLQQELAQREEQLAQKQSLLNKGIDEHTLAQSQSIPYESIRDTKVILKDDMPPFEAEFAVIHIADIQTNFSKSGTQGRILKQEKVIQDILEHFKSDLIFFREGDVNGLPIITPDGKVVSGNHRSEAIMRILSDEAYAKEAKEYIQSAKAFLGVDLQKNQAVVRRLKEQVSDKDILSLAFSSNIGRESTIGEKALSNLAFYKQNIKDLPPFIESQSVDEQKAYIAKHLDIQNNGLNVFDTNLALLAYLSKNSHNTDIINALDSIGGSAQERVKVIHMFVDNAGSFHNLVHHPLMKNLELRDSLSEAVHFVAKADTSRSLDFAHLNEQIEGFVNLTDELKANVLALDSNKVNNLTNQALGFSLAKFARQENPSQALYEALSIASQELEKLTQPTLFAEGKPLNEINIYDFIKYLIQSGQSSKETSKLIDNLTQLESYAKGKAKAQEKDITFTDSKGKSHTISPEIQEQWLKTFNLKSIDDTYTPAIPQEAKEALGGKEIRLTQGSLYKLIERGREKYIPQIKETLEQPEVILRDSSEVIFAKKIKNDLYLTSIGKNFETHITIISNAPKTTKTIENKISNGAKIIWQNAEGLLTSGRTLTDKAELQGSIGNTIIPQKAEQYYTLRDSISNLKRELKDAEFDKGLNQQFFEKWGEDAKRAYLVHKRLAKEHNLTPKNFSEFKAEFNPILEKKLQERLQLQERIPQLQKQLEQTQEAVDSFKIQGYENIQGFFLPLDYKDTSDFIAQIEKIEHTKYGLYNAIKAPDFEKENARFIESLSQTHTKEQRERLAQTFDEAKALYDSLKRKDIESFYNKAKLLEKKKAKLQELTFTDSKGKSHTITPEVQEQWLKTFNLKSIDEDFIPSFTPEVQEALQKVGINTEQVRLTKGSLIKLVKENRVKYLDRIKPTLQEPDRIIRQDENTIIFAKDFNEVKYFTSVVRDEKGEWIVRSNAPKSENGLNNKIANGGEEIYQANSQINAKVTYDDEAKSNTKLDNAIIPQKNTKLQSNAHIGSGLVSGSVAGFETDESGNLSFNPAHFLLGLGTGAVGSKAITQGFKAINKNPEFKAKVTQELADTLAKGWDSATKKYPILSTLEPRYIVKNERGRSLQAQHILKEVENLKQGDLVNVEKLQDLSVDLPKALSKEEFINYLPKNKQGKSILQTPIGEVLFDLKFAWNHLTNNTYQKDRRKFSGAFFDTFADPLLVVKQKYTKNTRTESKSLNIENANNKPVHIQSENIITKDSYVFFKPYKQDSTHYYLAGYAIDEKGELINTTMIPYTNKDLSRIKKIIFSKTEDILYLKGKQ